MRRFGLSLTKQKSIVKQKLLGLVMQSQGILEQKNTEETLCKLKHRGERIYMDSSVRVTGAEYIEIGDDTIIQPYSRIEAINYYGGSGQRFRPRLSIGARCTVEFSVHIGVCYSVEIGNDVMIAGRVYISDHVHNYDDPTKPVNQQPLSEQGHVSIGDGSHIGEGACIFSDVTLGEHVIVGANAIVTKDVPAFCVVAGAPARILRHYNFERQAWEAGPPQSIA